MKKELKDILVPVDFNQSSIEALEFACTIAQKIDTNIVVLNVMQIPGFIADLFTTGDELVKLSSITKDKLQELIEKVQVSFPGIEMKSRIVRGKPYQKILDVAEEINARMIVLGENHQGDEATKDLGSTVYHVTLKSLVPVLTYKGKHDTIIDNILVPLDLIKQTKKQLFSAMIYGLNYGAKIHLVSALIGGVKIRNSRIYKKLKQAKKTLEENGIDCEIKLFERSDIPPYKRVLEYSEEIKADMVMLMTHQEGYTYDNYIGAFAHHIINESRVPVLTLTSSASTIDSKKVITPFVDPFAIFNKK